MTDKIVDQFAAIALRPARSNRPALQPIPPLSLPNKRLESRLNDGLGAPPPAARLRTPQDVRARGRAARPLRPFPRKPHPAPAL